MNTISKGKKLPPVSYPVNPPFGTIFAPHVLRMPLKLEGPNDFSAEIKQLEAEPFYPTCNVFHYGQSIFEGMKAFRQKDGSVGVFRADRHATRFRASAKRMIMADIPEEIFLNCIKEYVDFVSDNVPGEPDHSLYLRPVMFAADQKIKVGAAQNYLFYIMSSIAGNYFGSGGKIKPARVMVNREFVRAYPGGLGEVKTAANYAASIWPQRIAAQKECDQVLFLEATTHDLIDEMGGMNFFIVRGNELITPALTGTILNGVTRKSILEIAPSLGLKPVEAKISFTQLRTEIENGTVTDTFACGTAAVVHPIGEFLYQENLSSQAELIRLKNEPSVSIKILNKLQNIQRGIEPAPGRWIF